MNQDNSQSWVRISYGTIKYVVDSIQGNTEIPVDPQEEQVPLTSIQVVAARSKAKAKPQPRVLVGTTTTIPMHERRWIDIEPSEQNLASYDLSKKVINLLRHNQTLQREDDGANEFYKIKFYLRNHHSQIQVWSDDRWKACLAAGGGSKRRYQYCSDDSGSILYLRALQGHSGSNLIDPMLQDNVVIGSGIFHYIYHIGCAFNLHSIINNGLIPGGQGLSRRQTVFFLPADPRDENHKDPEHIDFSVPRRARYVHSAWKRHQDVVFWVDINLAIREGLTFYQTRSNAIILQGTLPAYCIPKVERLKTGEVLYERPYLSPRPPPKISLRHLASFNADNEFNRATDEENIDFNIPGVPNSTVKRSHGVNVQNLIQKTENHPQRQALQSDLQQDRAFNPFSKESQDVIKQLEILNYARYSKLSQKHNAEYASRIGTLASSTARAGTSYEMIRQKIKSTSSLFLISSLSRTFTSGRVHHGHSYGKKEGAREYHTAKTTPKEVQETRILEHSRSIYS